MTGPQSQRLWLLLVLLAAAGLRFTLIGDLPAGLQHDEAAYGIDARDVLIGNHAIFFERSNGREPLFIYLFAGSYWLFGIGVWQQRIVSAAIGLLTVAALYRFGYDRFGGRVALFAAAFIGLAYWPVHVSHTAFRAITLPLFLTIAAILFARALERRGLGPWSLAGLGLGVTMYTYLSNRILPLVVGIWLLGVVWGKRDSGENGTRGQGVALALPGVAIMFAVWAVVFAPLGWYFWTHPDAFALRSVQVNDLRPILLEGDFRPLIRDTLATLGMFVVHGDDSWKYNLSGRPVFDPISGVLFLLGLAIAWRRRRDVAYLMVLGWLVVMLIPGFVSGESPHFLRTIGALPAVFLLPAIGLDAVTRRVKPIVLGFVLFGVLTGYDVFVRWANSPEQRAFFRADYAVAARLLSGLPGPVTIAAEYPYDLDPLTFDLIAGRRVEARWFDGERSLILPAAGGTLLTPGFARPEAEGRTRLVIDGPVGQPGLVGYDVATVRAPVGGQAFGVTVGKHLRLDAAAVPATIQAGGTMTVPVSWSVLADNAPGDLSFSLKLVGPWASVWSQDDLSPAPPADWRSGDRLVISHRLATDTATAPGVYQLVLQVYRRSTLAAERVAGPDPERFTLGTVEVTRGAPVAQVVNVRDTTSARFVVGIELAGYEIDKPVAAAGESLGLTLYWRALRGDLPDLTVFTHLIHETQPDRLWGQRDSQPVFGAYPTNAWQSGELIKDRYDLPIDPAAPAGNYRIAVGLYQRETGTRIPLEPANLSPYDQTIRILARLGLPYDRERIEADRVLLKRNLIERR